MTWINGIAGVETGLARRLDRAVNPSSPRPGLGVGVRPADKGGLASPTISAESGG